MHKGQKPAAQPRSLRSIAESVNTGGGFLPDPDYDAQAGVPRNVPGVQGTYADPGNTATFGKQGERASAPSPFVNVRSGR